MPNFSTRGIGTAGYTDTTGIIEYASTTGTGGYVLRGPLPGFAAARSQIADAAPVRYRATDGRLQEIADGVFDFAANTLSRDTVLLPRAEPVDWPPGRKLIYILNFQ